MTEETVVEEREHYELLPGVTDEGTVVVTGRTPFPFPFGNIGPWYKGDFYMVNGTDMRATLEASNITPDFVIGFDAQNGRFERCYFKVDRRVEADAAQKIKTELVNVVRKEAGKEPLKSFGAQLITQFACDQDQVLPEPSQFELAYDVEKHGFGTKNGHGYNLVTVVSIVKAIADLYGWQTPDISFADLTDREEAESIPEDQVGRVWDNLMLQRAELWKALGEDDVRKAVALGTLDSSGKLIRDSVVTHSEKLSTALRMASGKWQGNFYVNIGQVFMPRNPKMRVPVVIKMFRTKADAEKYIAERRNRADVEHEEATAVLDEYAGLFVMDGLTGQEFAGALMSEFPELVEEVNKATGSGKIKAQKKLNEKLGEYGLDTNTWNAWKERLGL